MADAVGAAADHGAEVGGVVEVAVEVVEAENQRVRDAGEPHVTNDGAEGDDPGAEVARRDRDLLHCRAVWQPAKYRCLSHGPDHASPRQSSYIKDARAEEQRQDTTKLGIQVQIV